MSARKLHDPDFVGAVIFPKSPRHIAPDVAGELFQPARGKARIVAVVVDPDDALLETIGRTLKPDLVQLHGRETPERLAAVRALTGAGVSTASGIPDYRSPGAPRRTPMTIQQFLGSPEFRRRYWARNHLGWRHMDAARPNAAHRALAALPGVTGVITQNVDLLHSKAGSANVVNLHGTYAQVICLDCAHTMTRAALAELLEDAASGVRPRSETLQAVRRVLEQAGVAFTFEPGAKPGLREA